MNFMVNSSSRPIKLIIVATLSAINYCTGGITIEASEYVSAVNTSIIMGRDIIVKQADPRSVSKVAQSLDEALARVSHP